MRESRTLPPALLVGLLAAGCLFGCSGPVVPPAAPLAPLNGAPDGTAEALRVDADSRNTLSHEEGSFLAYAREKDRVILVDFWAPWCGPCVQMLPELESIARQFPDEVTVVKVDIAENENSAIARHFDLQAIPDLRVFVNGEPVDRIQGYATAREFVDILAPHIATLKK